MEIDVDSADSGSFGEPAEGASATPDLVPVVGANLRRLRMRRGLSLERLARASAVSRAMLGQIELGQSAPTINVLGKIVRALDVPFSALLHAQGAIGSVVLRRSRSKLLSSHGGAFTSRALFPVDALRRVEFYELRLGPGVVEDAQAHPPGTQENLAVHVGTVQIELPAERHLLDAGDAILFEADQPHAYRNPSATEAIAYLVMTYAEAIG